MKEVRYFYVPEPEAGELSSEETQHAVRVLRLGAGDELVLVDGRGVLYDAVVSEATNHRCRYDILRSHAQEAEWNGNIHLAMAPTKNMDRVEWFVEKATEIGVDHISLLNTQFAERGVVKTERLERVAVAAMKQSHKAWKPVIDEMEAFKGFISRSSLPAQRFIAHCYDMADITADSSLREKPFLGDVLLKNTDALVMIGSEGDFSVDEVRAAEAAGFRSVSLGTSRLRTETAALVAVHLMRLANR
ncbi:MAG: 16S rRNA (uracil(1498)-N(3))-methyltransferase [Bacteroidaceae bacterium]|nr:16S rRNA (uracil(1498)-N(3))-methyltransferase [Bacteroidaceae bacterium]